MNVIGKITRVFGSRLLTVNPRPVRLPVQQAVSQPTVSSGFHRQFGIDSKGLFTCQRGSLSHAVSSHNLKSSSTLAPRVTTLLTNSSTNLQFTRSYKVKTVLSLRCSGCYYIRRHGRLFVECKIKPRHKQMAKISKHKLMVDDTSKGNVRRACWWKFRTERWYKKGQTPYVKAGCYHQGIGIEF
ncbi:54S ribosomal protein c83.06c, mitochondrial [Mizuhopecten yessoensis]|uniref:Ribosomal protein n=1 Tax=Mizuhopecten yessoensis TaxID=6573 RepID=A0A210PT22_MIZYE|nr:54S ribosomal protein c83.06c, mitochondrial [Mizuhopecten yessoensis]